MHMTEFSPQVQPSSCVRRPRKPHRATCQLTLLAPFSPSFLSSFPRCAWELCPSKLQSPRHDEMPSLLGLFLPTQMSLTLCLGGKDIHTLLLLREARVVAQPKSSMISRIGTVLPRQSWIAIRVPQLLGYSAKTDLTCVCSPLFTN